MELSICSYVIHLREYIRVFYYYANITSIRMSGFVTFVSEAVNHLMKKKVQEKFKQNNLNILILNYNGST
jgi:hypothetical protein